jgi:hypothetical protein
MQPEPQILNLLQPLIDEQMGLALAFPCHEDGGELEPFVWQRAEQGTFSPWNLLQSQGWVHSSDLTTVLQLWQAPEVGAVNGDQFLIPENDPAGILLDDQTRTARAEAYAELGQLLESGLQNLQVYELSCDSDYRLGLVVGQAEGGLWLGLGSTVPIATPASPSPLKTVAQPDPSSPTPPDSSDDAGLPAQIQSRIQSQIQSQIARLVPLTIYGYYGGGYNQTHIHQFVSVAAADSEQVLEALLRQLGLFRLSQFEGFAPTLSTEDSQFAALTDCLHRSFSSLWVYRFSFWTWEQVFILGEQAEDWGGVVLRSHFTYNP